MSLSLEAEHLSWYQQIPHCTQPPLNSDAVIRECQIAKHKAKIVKYETYLGIESYLCRLIVKSVDHKWIAEVKSEMMGFNHLFYFFMNELQADVYIFVLGQLQYIHLNQMQLILFDTDESVTHDHSTRIDPQNDFRKTLQGAGYF